LPTNVPSLPAENEGWRDVYCDATDELTDDFADGPTRWRDAKANDAWTAALSCKSYSK